MTRFFFRSLQLAIDAALVAAAFVAAYLIRFEGVLPWNDSKQLLLLLPYVVMARLLTNQAAGVYNVIWRYTGMKEIRTFFAAAVLPSSVFLILRLTLPSTRARYGRIPLSIIAIELLLAFLFMFGARVARRVIFERSRDARGRGRSGAAKPILLIGAGSAGVIIAREIQAHAEMGLRVVGFVDDDPGKRGHVIHGVPVLGATSHLPTLVRKHAIDHVVISIAGASGTDMRRIVAVCDSIPVRRRIIPGVYELVDGSVKVSRIRDVELEDLLGRAPVQLDMEGIGRFLRGKSILVTGAGGSIGAEMCRQVCRFEPARLVLVERAENSLFDIERDLRATFPAVDVVPCMADISDRERMEGLFAVHAPRVVIHAAAHKHVPMMEANPGEAIKNNVFGTRLVADLADRTGALAFVMISTDKAVNPTSVMGASKRVAEMYVQGLTRRSQTRFITVRFGNVLGSVGSVIPIFKEQIARGGPVTVTHPDMRRYFMTIPEAAQLVLQAASMGEGGEIYVLDMGEPVKIVTLAEELIRFSGLEPYDDVDIVFTGMRPGEKLFEEIALDDEAAVKTRHPKIYVGRTRGVPPEGVDALLSRIAPLVDHTSGADVRAALMTALADTERAETGAPRAAGAGRAAVIERR